MGKADLAAEALAAVRAIDVDAISGRQGLEYWSKPGRRGIERVTWAAGKQDPPRAACVKHGPELEREALAQSALVDAVPPLLGCRALAGGGVVVATRRVQGRKPDFSTAADLVAGFAMAGRFAAQWAERARSCLEPASGMRSGGRAVWRRTRRPRWNCRAFSRRGMRP